MSGKKKAASGKKCKSGSRSPSATSRGRSKVKKQRTSEALTDPPATGDVNTSDATGMPSRRASVVEISDDDDEPAESHWEDEEESSDAELERLAKKWTATVYAFYEPTPEIKYEGNHRFHGFRCAKRGCKHVVRRYLDGKDAGSTGNMRKHAKSCWGPDVVERADEMKDVDDAREKVTKPIAATGSITAAFERTGKGKITYSHKQHTKAETRAEIVKWVAASQRPFSIVKDTGFNVLMKTGRPEYWIPSDMTVARDVRTVFRNARKRIAKMLQEHDGALHFATDCWTSPNHRAYTAVTVHFEADGVPMSVLLDVVEIAKSHSGLNLAIAFADILNDFGIADKLLNIACDNASNNDVMIRELTHLITTFPGEANRTRCFLHIVNLVAKTLLRQFDPPKKDAEKALSDAEKKLIQLSEELEFDDELNSGLGQSTGDGDEPEDDGEGWVDEMAQLSNDELERLSEEIMPVRLALVKLRKLAFKILHSPTKHLPRWREILKELKHDERIMPRDVTTRWNSTYDMLEFAIRYRLAIDKITGERTVDPATGKSTSELRILELDEGEWTIMGQLADVLKVLKHATLFFSRATPNLAKVIPAMDHIDKVLSNASLDSELNPAIRASLVLAKRTLNRYYSSTDYYDVYRIAMVLHPQYKTEYFRRMKWPQEWIDTAITITRDEYERSYAHRTPRSQSAASEPIAPEASSKTQTSDNIFNNLSVVSAPAASISDELAAYLAAAVENPEDGNALLWWKRNAATYPRLSRMALDYLSIPATSVDVERTFSRGRILLSHIRNKLSAQSTRALLCLGSWVPLGLIKTKDIMAVTVQQPTPEEEELTDDWADIARNLSDDR